MWCHQHHHPADRHLDLLVERRLRADAQPDQRDHADPVPVRRRLRPDDRAARRNLRRAARGAPARPDPGHARRGLHAVHDLRRRAEVHPAVGRAVRDRARCCTSSRGASRASRCSTRRRTGSPSASSWLRPSTASTVWRPAPSPSEPQGARHGKGKSQATAKARRPRRRRPKPEVRRAFRSRSAAQGDGLRAGRGAQPPDAVATATSCCSTTCCGSRTPSATTSTSSPRCATAASRWWRCTTCWPRRWPCPKARSGSSTTRSCPTRWAWASSTSCAATSKAWSIASWPRR